MNYELLKVLKEVADVYSKLYAGRNQENLFAVLPVKTVPAICVI
jgi:hypothetical protein